MQNNPIHIEITSEILIWSVPFTPAEKQKKYIASQLSCGDYQNASEVVREALCLHELYRNKVLEELRTEIDRGWDGSLSEHSVDDIVNARKKAYKAK